MSEYHGDEDWLCAEREELEDELWDLMGDEE